MVKQIHIQYYALLKEQRGQSEETLETAAGTLEELFEELNGTYHFSLGKDRLKAAINDEMTAWSTQLKDKDTVVFIPPVAGG